MKITLLLSFCLLAGFGYGQKFSPDSWSAGYFGEMISHPGIKVAAHFNLKSKEKTRKEKKITKSIEWSPSIYGFYHRRYQTGFILMPEITAKRINQKGNFWNLTLGAGYLRTFIPNTYSIDEKGEIEKVLAGQNQFVMSLSAGFGHRFQSKGLQNFSCHFQPQFIYALPGFPKGIGYLALNLGFTYHLKNTTHE
ncbi:MAG: hypothetical protein R2879_18445 [Saprospiraceae bacterium]